MITGFKDNTHALDTRSVPVNVQNIGKYRTAFEVFSNSCGYLTTFDTAEALSTNTVIVATAHGDIKVGDIIQFTSGVLLGEIAFVETVTVNSITVSQKLSSAPGIGDAFDVLRIVPFRVSSGGSVPAVVTNETQVPGSPLVVSVGAASTLVFTPSPLVKKISMVNMSANTISFGYGTAAILNQGDTIIGRGSSIILDNPFTQAINAIASVGASTLTVQAWT